MSLVNHHILNAHQASSSPLLNHDIAFALATRLIGSTQRHGGSNQGT
jgi:hypothetical protein